MWFCSVEVITLDFDDSKVPVTPVRVWAEPIFLPQISTQPVKSSISPAIFNVGSRNFFCSCYSPTTNTYNIETFSFPLREFRTARGCERIQVYVNQVWSDDMLARTDYCYNWDVSKLAGVCLIILLSLMHLEILAFHLIRHTVQRGNLYFIKIHIDT